MKLGPFGGVFSVNTDMGVIRLSIDTGASGTFVRSSRLEGREVHKIDHTLPVFTSSTFVIGGKDFGSMDLHLLNIAPEWHEIDGLLGMDFLENHVVYIDNQKNVVYIGECNPSSQVSQEMDAA